MKKFMFILVALIGLGLNAFAGERTGSGTETKNGVTIKYSYTIKWTENSTGAFVFVKIDNSANDKEVGVGCTGTGTSKSCYGQDTVYEYGKISVDFGCGEIPDDVKVTIYKVK
jgi:hypothetical protein